MADVNIVVNGPMAVTTSPSPCLAQPVNGVRDAMPTLGTTTFGGPTSGQLFPVGNR